MNKFVCDTMALVLRLENRKLPQKAKEKFEQAEKRQAEIIVPSLVFAELAYLSEKKRIDVNLTDVSQYLEKYSSIIECA